MKTFENHNLTKNRLDAPTKQLTNYLNKLLGKNFANTKSRQKEVEEVEEEEEATATVEASRKKHSRSGIEQKPGSWRCCFVAYTISIISNRAHYVSQQRGSGH